MTNDAAEPLGVRASDTEREQIARTLQAAGADGRLTMAETDQRLAAAYAALYRHELQTLTNDLPAEPSRERAVAAHPGRRRPLVVHATVVAVFSALLIAGWIASPARVFWPAWPMMWMAISLVIHSRARSRGWRSGPWARRGYGPPRWSGPTS